MNAGRETGDARSVLQTLKMLEYQYSAPAREVITWLRLFPRAKRGPQLLLRRECDVWPRPDRTRRFTDQFGNEVALITARDVPLSRASSRPTACRARRSSPSLSRRRWSMTQPRSGPPRVAWRGRGRLPAN